MKYPDINHDEHLKHCAKGKRNCPICKYIYYVRYYQRKKATGPRHISINAFLEKAKEYNKAYPIVAMSESRAFIEHEIYNGRLMV